MMSTDIRKRGSSSSLPTSASNLKAQHDEGKNISITNKSLPHQRDAQVFGDESVSHDEEVAVISRENFKISWSDFIGVFVMLITAVGFAYYVSRIHETRMWFSNIQVIFFCS